MGTTSKTRRIGDILNTTGDPVEVYPAAPPTIGQVLQATSATAATWQTPAVGGSPSPVITLLQEKILASDVTSVGLVGSMQLTGLTIGQVYEVVGSITMSNNGGGGPTGLVQHNGATIWGFQNDGTAASEGECSGHFSEYFTATATTVEFNVTDAAASKSLGGNGTKAVGGTWLQVRHISGASATTVNVLASNVSTTGDVAALGFTGLTIGNQYEVIGQISMLITSSGSCTGRVLNGTTELFPFDFSGDGVEANCTGYTSGVFTALATTVVFTLDTAGANQLVEGNASKSDSGTFLELRPINTQDSKLDGKVLEEDATATGLVDDLTFDGLEFGKQYEIVGSLSSYVSDDTIFACNLENNGDVIGAFSWNAAGALEEISTGVSTGVFTATSPKVVIRVTSAGANHRLKGDGTTGNDGSWLKLRELKG